jgi:homoserine dehydrogenase
MRFDMAFAGFGVVARGLSELLMEKQDELREKYGMEWRVVAVSDKLTGDIANPDGLDLPLVVQAVEEGRGLVELDAPHKGFEVLEMLEKGWGNTLVEVTYTDVKTGEPATAHIRAALDKGMHVVTTNKGPFIHHCRELMDLAEEKGVGLGFDGVVMAGTPTLGFGLRNLAGSKFTSCKGILNGTTNYMLTEMEKGMSYDDVLKKAQELGYAEADPAGDVEGWDALGKIVVLANLFLGASLTPDDIPPEGITNITQDDIEKAKAEGARWKLIASATRDDSGNVSASVRPEMMPLSDPLAGVMGPVNALTFECDTLGAVTVVGPGAGKVETGFALLMDLLEINRRCG